MSKDLIAVRSELSETKKLALKKIEKLTEGSDWHLLQTICQEIEAGFIINKTAPTNPKILENLKSEVKARYNDQPDLVEVLEEAIPSVMTISKWRKKKGWEDAVWQRVRGEGLFTNDNRAAIVNKLFEQAALDGNVQAAKIWLTLSGDYSEKDSNVKSNEVADIFRSINETIHSKK